MSSNSIMDLLTGPDAAAARQQLSQKLGLDEQQTGQVLQSLLPALAGGIASNAQKPGGVEALLGALSSGRHASYLDNPQSLASPETLTDGNAILGHLLGSKDMSRTVAAAASQKTGIDNNLMKMALPIIATMVMGQLSKQTKGANASAQPGGFDLGGLMDMIGGAAGGSAGASQNAGGGLLGGLASMLDGNKDGSPIDDIFDMVMKSRK